MFRILIISAAFFVIFASSQIDDKYYNDIQRRLDRLIADMKRKAEIREQKRRNLEFANEAVFNKTVKTRLDFPRDESILQLIGCLLSTW